MNTKEKRSYIDGVFRVKNTNVDYKFPPFLKITCGLGRLVQSQLSFLFSKWAQTHLNRMI